MLSAAGMGASTLVKSPAQVAAEAKPPVGSVVSAVVERRVLKETVTLRGTVTPGRTIEVVPLVQDEATKLVVSAPPLRVGARVHAGKVVAVVSGRPLIALRGSVPAYRDLRTGMKGPDVLQLQRALREIGYSLGDAEGVFGPTTQAAVQRMYSDRGFEAEVEETTPAADQKNPEKPIKPVKTVVLHSGELVFVPKFPARVIEVKAALGSEVKGVLLKLAAGELRVRGLLSRADRKLVRKGMPVELLAEESGLEIKGRISAIGTYTQDTDGAEPGHPVFVDGIRPLPQQLSGQDIRLTIEAASTGNPVLAVPASAIYAVADGSVEVIKLLPDGRQSRVTVTVGATGGGSVEVRAENLTEGDRVVVGER